MNAEQKQRAKDALTNCQASDMAALLQEMIATHEPKPVARVTGYYAGYLSIATVDGRVLPAGTALYAAPPHQSEHHLEMVNTPAPSVPDGWLEILEAVLREMPARKGVNGNAPGHGHRIAGIWDDDNGPLSGKPCAWCMTWNKVKAMLAAQQPAQPADLVRDAERYRWLRNWTRRAYGIDSNPAFILPHVPIPTGPDQNIMRGSLAQHLDNAIDAAIERDKKGDQS